LPYKIWIAIMAIILYSRVHSNSLFFFEWPRTILLSSPLQFMGRTSYAAYLLHWIIIEIVLFWIIRFAPGFDNKYLLTVSCLLAVYPMTYVASAIIHRHVERPLIQFPAWWRESSIRNRMMLARNDSAI
jgi:peptidoglycan/LPS O-acetylase OafA/YrhL